MEHIYKSVLLGIFTISIWIFASFMMVNKLGVVNDSENTIVEKKEEIHETFVETLTIDYKGAIH